MKQMAQVPGSTIQLAVKNVDRFVEFAVGQTCEHRWRNASTPISKIGLKSFAGTRPVQPRTIRHFSSHRRMPQM